MKQALLLALALGSFVAQPACAQGSNTIYQALSVNVTDASPIYGPVQNNGQVSHQAYILLSSKPTKTCDVTQAQYGVQLLGSNTNSVGTVQVIPQINNSGFGTVFTQGNASYPYVWVEANFLDPSGNCQYSVYYSGSVQPLVLKNTNLQVGGSAGTFTPTTYTLVFAGGSQQSIFVFGYTLSTVGAAATATFQCANGGGPFGAKAAYSLVVGTAVVVPVGNIPVFQCPAGARLDFVVAGAGATVTLTSSITQPVQFVNSMFP